MKKKKRLFGPLPLSSKIKDFKNIHPDDIEKVQKFNLDISSEKIQTMDIDFRIYVPDKINNRIDMKWVYHRLISSKYRGRKAIFAIIKHGEEYKELGADYLSKRNVKNSIALLKRKAQELGMELVPVAGA